MVHHGLFPYRDFHVDYPPGALPVFALPSLASASYDATFAWLMAACGVALRRASLGSLAAAAAAWFVARSSPLARRVADPLALRPLAGAARDGRAGGARHRPRPARLGAARRGGRREGLAAGAGAARARLGVAAARGCRRALGRRRACSRSRSCRSRSSRRTALWAASPARRPARCRSRASAPRSLTTFGAPAR